LFVDAVKRVLEAKLLPLHTGEIPPITVFSSKNLEMKLVDTALRLNKFTYISISKVKCVVPHWSLVLVFVVSFLVWLEAT
jgi:hypothetical protein